MKCILVADDEPLVRMLIGKTLAAPDVAILQAADGWEALRVAREQRPDLLILDDCMPGPSGSDVCRTLRQEPASWATPVILMGEAGKQQEAGARAGANHFFPKPFSPLDLIHRVKELLL